MPKRRLVLDACVLINLLATSQLEQVAAACDARFVIVEEVASEAFFLRDDQTPGGRAAVDLDWLVAADDLEVVRLKGTELEAYVGYARRVDDGEAASVAVAAARGWGLATDDRAALRLLRELDLIADRYTTPSLLRIWATEQPDAVVSAALRDVERRARFVPGDHDPDANWWRTAVAAVGTETRSAL